MTSRTVSGTEVEIIALIQRYSNGDARVSIRQVGRPHYEITRRATLQADGGPRELAAAVARAEQSV